MSSRLSKYEIYTILVLVYINLIAYMDRFTVAAVLEELQEDFKIGDAYGGLLQTAFIGFYTIFAPIFGYIGDRYSRRLILTLSLILWASAILIGSFMKSYWPFFMTRAVVGIGQTSFCTIAPTVIYDVTYYEVRKNYLALFYVSIPIGAGLGFVLGAKAFEIGGHWSYCLRITPLLSLIGVVLMCFTKDPVRGERERLDTGRALVEKPAHFRDDLKTLCKNRSYLLSTFGFTSASFVGGALAWWAPKYVYSGFRLIPGEENLTSADVSSVVGIIAVLTGLIGVPMGAYIAAKLEPRYPAIDPILCGAGLSVSCPLLIASLFFADKSIPLTFVTVFTGEMFMNFTWTIVSDILLSTVVPECRSSAEAFQITISHALGDAGSPYIVGVVSELLQESWRESQEENDDQELVNQHLALRYGLLSVTATQPIGAILFFINALYIVEDRAAVKQAIARTATEVK